MRSEILAAMLTGAIVALAIVSIVAAALPPAQPTVLVDAPIASADWQRCVPERPAPPRQTYGTHTGRIA
jgi:hypothetical protein